MIFFKMRSIIPYIKYEILCATLMSVKCIRLGKDRSDQDKFLVLNAIDFERSFIAFIFVPIRILFVSACTK